MSNAMTAWEAMAYPNHDLLRWDKMYGIGGADLQNGAPYSIYMVPPGAPYHPLSLVFSDIGIPWEQPTTLRACFQRIDVVDAWLKGHYKEVHSASPRGIREAAATYYHRKILGIR